MRLIQGGGGTSLTAAQTTALAALTTDVVAAITGAASPSGANVFGTAAGIVSAAERAKITAIPTLTAPLSIASASATLGTPTSTETTINGVSVLEVLTIGTVGQTVTGYVWSTGFTDRVTCRIRAVGLSVNYVGAFAIMYESATGKCLTIGPSFNNGGRISMDRYTGITGTATNIVEDLHMYGDGQPQFFRLVFSGANILGQCSWDGSRYHTIGTVAKTTAFTTTADRAGFAANGIGGSGAVSYGGICDSMVIA